MDRPASYSKIDVAAWDRAEYFSFYTTLDFPYINIGAHVDVTNLLDFAQAHGLSSYLTLIQGTDVGLGTLSHRRDLIGYSAVPWLQYTHFVRTIARSGVDSNPKMSWGKYFHQEGRVLVTFSVQVHHGLMDGFHIGRFYQALQANIDLLA